MANAHINEQSGDIDQVTERPSRSWTTLELAACCLSIIQLITGGYQTRRPKGEHIRCRKRASIKTHFNDDDIPALSSSLRPGPTGPNLLRRCSCLSDEEGGVLGPLGPQLRQHFSSESLTRTSSPNFVNSPSCLPDLREGCLRFELCI